MLMLRRSPWCVVTFEPIPDVSITNASLPDAIRVKLSDDGLEFTLRWSGSELGPYSLPATSSSSLP